MSTVDPASTLSDPKVIEFDDNRFAVLTFVAYPSEFPEVTEITGTKGAIRFDQEDQNALWLYRADDPEEERGFKKILAGPAHPDYVNFCLGPGHGCGGRRRLLGGGSYLERHYL